jgi:hypothetical protein
MVQPSIVRTHRGVHLSVHVAAEAPFRQFFGTSSRSFTVSFTSKGLFERPAKVSCWRTCSKRMAGATS